MAHETEIAHHVPGRIRLKVKAARGNDVLLEQIRRALLPIAGVKDVTVNSFTGSVVMHYDPEAHTDFHQHLQHHCKEHLDVCRAPEVSEVDGMARNLEQEAEFLAEHSKAARVVVDLFKDLDRQLKIATGNAVDLKVVAPLGLAIFTFLELGLEAATPIWLTLGLFSLNHFVEMHAHPEDDEPDEQRRPAPLEEPLTAE